MDLSSAAVSTWVAELEMGGVPRLRGVLGPTHPQDQAAYVLVRLHGAPVGFVSLLIPTGPTRRDGQDLLDEALALARARFDGSALMHVAGNEFPQAERPPISVVLCTRDRAELLRQSLARLSVLDYPSFEVVVVDNAPSDDSTRRCVVESVGADERFRYVLEPVAGLANARNRGMKEAAFGIVAFTDDDVLVDEGWLAGVAAGFGRDEAVGCVTGMVAPGELRSPAQHWFHENSWWPMSPEPRTYGRERQDDLGSSYPFDAGQFGTGANFALDKELGFRIGGFDPILGAGGPVGGGEDLDMFVRVLFAGRTLAYEPTALVWHTHRETEDELARQIQGRGTGLGAYLVKQLVEPETRNSLLRTVPALLRHLGRFRRRRLPPDSPTAVTDRAQLRLTLIDAKGMVVGATRYFAVRLRRRRR